MTFSVLPKRSWVRKNCIGKGSFGAVSLAVDMSNGYVFAVKSVNSSSEYSTSLHSLENEIGILRSISSPYIVSCLGDDVTFEPSGGRWRNLHMEYMPGGTVADLAAGYGKMGGGWMGENALRSYTRCAVEGLRYLHSAGIVHCDVKGKNILIGHNQEFAKLADFGSARRVSGDNSVGFPQGTPLWMAPEVVRGEFQTPESDVWSLGCTVIEMVTGQAPWKSQRLQDATGTLFQIGFGGEVPEFPSQLSMAGLDFLDKCLRRNPGERWTCEQLLQHQFLAGAAAETEQSPRSVLSWIGSDFQSETDEGFSSSLTSEVFQVPNSNEAKLRLGGLASGKVVDWEEEIGSWEVVREEGAMVVSGVEGEKVEEEEGGGICREYLNCEGTAGDHACGGGAGVEASGGNCGAAAAGGGMSFVVRCFTPGSCSCSLCGGEVVGLGYRNRGAVLGNNRRRRHRHKHKGGGGFFGGGREFSLYCCFVWTWLIHNHTSFLWSHLEARNLHISLSLSLSFHSDLFCCS